MAIFSLELKIIGRGQKKSGGVYSLRTVVAAAAYRAGEKIQNLVDGVVYDFTRKQGVIHSEILLPKGASERYRERAALWNDIEALEKRKDAQFCGEARIALPVELSHEECIKLSRAYIKKAFVNKGMIADFSFHDPYVKNGQRNPHIHVMLTMRELTPDGKLGKKNRTWNDNDNAQRWREGWAIICNKWLARGGFEQRIDHRSYKAQGIDKVPTVHLGTEAAALERKGIRTAKGNINRAITAHNFARECGIQEPTILANIAKQWQGVRDLRGDVGSSRSFSRKARAGSSLPEETDTDRTGVQRRTYTSQSDVVRQGQSPAPKTEKRDALQGDIQRGKPPLEATQREQQASPTDRALPRTAQEKKLSLGERLASWRTKEKDTASNRGAAVYDIKVTLSMLADLSRHGIDSYAQLEQKLADCTEQVSAAEQRLTTSKDELHRAYYMRKVALSCQKTGADAARLREQLGHSEALAGAALRCQANRSYAEEYKNKVLFRNNYYKKFGDKIDAYTRAAEQLQQAGLSEHIEPAQLRQTVERLKKELKLAHQKYRRTADMLSDAGIDADTPPTYLEELIAKLKAKETACWREVQPIQRELEHWQRIATQLDNVLEGKRAKELEPLEHKDKDKNTPSR